jgi:hypothetical protein
MTLEAVCQGLLYSISIQVACFFLSLLIVYCFVYNFRTIETYIALTSTFFKYPVGKEAYINRICYRHGINQHGQEGFACASIRIRYVSLPGSSTTTSSADIPDA